MTTSNKDFGKPKLSETMCFWFPDVDGVWSPAIGTARYFTNSTIIIHRGARKVSEEIISAQPQYVRLYDKAFEVDFCAMTTDGYARLIVDCGYSDLFSEQGLLYLTYEERGVNNGTDDGSE